MTCYQLRILQGRRHVQESIRVNCEHFRDHAFPKARLYYDGSIPCIIGTLNCCAGAEHFKYINAIPSRKKFDPQAKLVLSKYVLDKDYPRKLLFIPAESIPNRTVRLTG